MSPYNYAAGNPISLIDYDGMLPRDPFDTEEKAAHDCVKNYQRLIYMKVWKGVEYDAPIYQYLDDKNLVKYTYDLPSMLYNKNSTDEKISNYFMDIKTGELNSKYTQTAYVHGQPPYQFVNDGYGLMGSENFSYGPMKNKEAYTFEPGWEQSMFDDIGAANKRKINAYLGTQGGLLKKFDYITKRISIIANDLPVYVPSLTDKDYWWNIENKQDKRPLPIQVQGPGSFAVPRDAKTEIDREQDKQ